MELQSFAFADTLSGFQSALDRGAFPLKQSQGCFRWTAGIRGLCALLLSAASRRACYDTERQWDLRGSRPSLALSLDYAIAKNTNWLCEYFGVDRQGETVFRRFIERENSELKRPGTMGIRLRRSIVDEMEFKVILDGQQIAGAESLQRLSDNLHRIGGEGRCSEQSLD